MIIKGHGRFFVPLIFGVAYETTLHRGGRLFMKKNFMAAFSMAAFLTAGAVLPLGAVQVFAATAPAAEAPAADTAAAPAGTAAANSETAAGSGMSAANTAASDTALNNEAADTTAAATAAQNTPAADAQTANTTAPAATAPDPATANPAAAPATVVSPAAANQTAADPAASTAVNPAVTNASVSAPQAAAATVSTANAQTVSGAQTIPGVPAVPMIYAVKTVSGSVIIPAEEAADAAAVSEHLEENLSAAVDASDGTNLTTEVWEHAIATVAWDPAPAGYDSTKKDEYAFTWSGVIKAGTIVYADATKLKAATVAADIPVVVNYTVTKGAASVSESKAPQTGDSFNPGFWVYFLVIGAVVALCSLILFRDTNEVK